MTADLEAGRQSIARRIPVGVIGIITPWNSPFIPGARAIGPALAMGNAVILKPDVQTPVAGGVTFAQEYLEGTFRVGFTREKKAVETECEARNRQERKKPANNRWSLHRS